MNTTKIGDIGAVWSPPRPPPALPQREAGEPLPVAPADDGAEAKNALDRHAASAERAAERRKPESAPPLVNRPAALTRQVGFEGSYNVVIDLLSSLNKQPMFRLFGPSAQGTLDEAIDAYGAGQGDQPPPRLNATA